MHAKNTCLRGWLPWLGLCLLFTNAQAATLQRAEITRLLNEVLVLKPGQKPEQAKPSEVITGETAVRTGAKSRAELEFSDKTLTRLGANSLFSFTKGTRDMSLEEGTMLLQVPKDAGGAKIRTAAVTAAITGTTVMVEHSKNNHSKLIVVEGTMRVYLPGKLGESILLKPGEMLILPPNATRLPNPVRVDLKKLVRTSRLFNTKDFDEIPSEDLVKEEVAQQQQELKDGKLVNTNIVLLGRGTEVVIATEEMLENIQNAVDADRVIVQEEPAPKPNPTPGPTPKPQPLVKYQPITTIPGTPYVINSSTEVITDPYIKTNGKRDEGTLFNASKQGNPAQFFFGGTTELERRTGFNGDMIAAGDVGVFEFHALEFRGSPNFVTKDGPSNVAFVSRGDITSSGNGFNLDFSQLNELYLLTHNGSIILGAGINEIVGPQNILELYARGPSSSIVLNAPVKMNQGEGILRLYSQNGVSINSPVSVKLLDVMTGGSVGINGRLSAPLINISAAGKVSLDARNLNIDRLEQLIVQSQSLFLNGQFNLSSSPTSSAGSGVASAAPLKGALFDIGIGGITGGAGLVLNGSFNVLSKGPIDFSAAGTVIHTDGVIESLSSIKFVDHAVVGSASAKNFIRFEGGSGGASLTANNGAIVTDTIDNGSSGYLTLTSPSLIEFTRLLGSNIRVDAPRVLRHGNGVSSDLPGFTSSVNVLQLDGNLEFDSGFYEPNLRVRLNPGFNAFENTGSNVTVHSLVTQDGGGVKFAAGSLTADVVAVSGNFGLSNAAYVENSFKVGGQFGDKDPSGLKSLYLGSGASADAAVAGGVDFQPSLTAVHADGGNFDIIADNGVTLGLSGIGGAGLSSPQINLRGRDTAGVGTNGGALNVMVSSSATRPILVAATFISTEKGATGSSNGSSGNVNLVHNSSSGSANGQIQVNNSRIYTGQSTGSRTVTASTDTVGSIKLQSLAQTNKGIRISNSSQLLALSNGALSGGGIDMITDGAAIDIINSTVRGRNVTIDTSNAGLDGNVSINNAVLQAQGVLKARAYGNNGVLTISNGASLSAGSQMKLYGGFSGGKVFFTGGGTISLNTPDAHIAANVVEVSNGTNVNNSGGNVNVYANGAGNHKYNTGGFGNINAAGSVIKTNSTTGAPGF